MTASRHAKNASQTSQDAVRTAIRWNFNDRTRTFVVRESTFCHSKKTLPRHRKARSAARKRLFRSTGKACLRYRKSQPVVRQRITQVPQKPRICNRNASCARRRQYCRLTVAYLCIRGRDNVYLCKHTHACMTGILPHTGHCQYDARDGMYAAVPAPCHAAARHLHKRKKACSGKAGTCHAFHISCLVITSEERRTSPAGQLLWWHQQTCRQALRS